MQSHMRLIVIIRKKMTEMIFFFLCHVRAIVVNFVLQVYCVIVLCKIVTNNRKNINDISIKYWTNSGSTTENGSIYRSFALFANNHKRLAETMVEFEENCRNQEIRDKNKSKVMKNDMQDVYTMPKRYN